MIKKKLLCFSLILTLASCLVACGDKEEKKPAETTTESTQESTTPEETTTEEETTSAEEETSTEEETTTEEATTEVPTTEAPTQKPTEAPTQKPTEAPTQKPTEAPTQKPTEAPTQKPTEAPTQKPTEPPTTEAPTTPALTERQKEAIDKVKMLADYNPTCSRNGSINSLVNQYGFSEDEALFAVDNAGIDWYQMAYSAAIFKVSFVDPSPVYTKEEMIAALKWSGFSDDEAEYGAEKYINEYLKK